MNFTKKGIKRSLQIQTRIKSAGFVKLEEPVNEKFKYNIIDRFKYVISNLLKLIKDLLVKNYQGACLTASKFDWKKIRSDVFEWLSEAFIEGLTANFATHFLFKVPLNPATVMAHGIIIKQGINLFWRLRNNGSNPTIPKKNK